MTKDSEVEQVTDVLQGHKDKAQIQKPRVGRKGRGLRRPEENIPGPDYILRIERLGPREGESYYAFRIRLAALREGRSILLESARRNYGNVSDVCREMGISRQNIPAHLKSAGLSTKELRAFRPEYRR